jgi:hypothetical protein
MLQSLPTSREDLQSTCHQYCPNKGGMPVRPSACPRATQRFDPVWRNESTCGPRACRPDAIAQIDQDQRRSVQIRKLGAAVACPAVDLFSSVPFKQFKERKLEFSESETDS